MNTKIDSDSSAQSAPDRSRERGQVIIHTIGLLADLPQWVGTTIIGAVLITVLNLSPLAVITTIGEVYLSRSI